MFGLFYPISNAETVKDLYDKMLASVKVKRSMPPNAWLWSMIANCKHHQDITLLFDILQNLRRFVSLCSLPLSPLYVANLRIHDNFLSIFVSRGCQIFAYMTILIAISVEKLLKHVFMLEPLILVCILYWFLPFVFVPYKSMLCYL